MATTHVGTAVAQKLRCVVDVPVDLKSKMCARKHIRSTYSVQNMHVSTSIECAANVCGETKHDTFIIFRITEVHGCVCVCVCNGCLQNVRIEVSNTGATEPGPHVEAPAGGTRSGQECWYTPETVYVCPNFPNPSKCGLAPQIPYTPGPPKPNTEIILIRVLCWIQHMGPGPRARAHERRARDRGPAAPGHPT